MIIREAQEADIKQWSTLRTQLWPQTDDNHLLEIRAYFSGSSIDIVKVFVAQENSTVIGFIELNIRNFAEGSRNPAVPYVEAWYVDSEHRKKGCGKQLMQKAEQWALSEGYSELASDTELYNVGSISIHKYLGFIETERVVCFLKQLGDV